MFSERADQPGAAGLARYVFNPLLTERFLKAWQDSFSSPLPSGGLAGNWMVEESDDQKQVVVTWNGTAGPRVVLRLTSPPASCRAEDFMPDALGSLPLPVDMEREKAWRTSAAMTQERHEGETRRDPNQTPGATSLLYMIIETFKHRDPLPVYRRFRDRGRLAPADCDTYQAGSTKILNDATR